MRFYIITLQWPDAGSGIGMHTTRGFTDKRSAVDAFQVAMDEARRYGAPAGANVIFFYLEPTR